MTQFRSMCRAVLCAAALSPLVAAHAVTYMGFTSADNFNPFDRQQDEDSGTTSTPTSYGVSVTGNVATSITDSAHGGSVYSYSKSFSFYSPEGGFTIGGGAGASTRIAYQVRLVGPDLPFVVPVHVVANGYVNGAGSTQASTSFVVNYDAGGASGQLLAGVNLTSVGGNSFSFDQVATFKVNSVFDVYLSADSGSGGPGTPAGWSEAFVDPSFTIDDPAFAALYRFEGVPGVPEPAGWALAMLGLAVVCGLRHRRPAEATHQVR